MRENGSVTWMTRRGNQTVKRKKKKKRVKQIKIVGGARGTTSRVLTFAL